MKNIAIVILILLIGVVIYQNLPSEEDEVINEETPQPENNESEKDLEIVYSEDTRPESIDVLNENEEVLHSMTIEEIQNWAEENWDIFEEPPQVAMREVRPGNFTFFDKTAKLSPDQNKLAFSVSDYAAATTLSFILIMDIESGELSMVKEPTRGSVDEFHWSNDSRFLAYSLNTARASGDLLSVDDIESMEKSFTLGEEDLLEILQPEEDPTFMPRFRDLEWREERLHFTTDSLEDEEINWSVKRNGEDLREEEMQGEE